MTDAAPGPWNTAYRQRADGMNSQEVFDANGETVAVCTWYPVSLPDGSLVTNREANARLISAAPDMLEALTAITERYVDLVGSGDCGFWNADEETVVKQARDAISKART